MNTNIFFEYGRLGNQLFQYAAIKSIYPNSRLVLFGFSSLNQLIERPQAIIITDLGKFRYFIKRLFRTSLNIISEKLKIIPCLNEKNIFGTCSIVENSGLYKKIKYIKSGNFQSEKYFDENFLNRIKIKQSAIKIAEDELSKLKINTTASIFFIHIRRGDYLWRNPGESPALSTEWYLKAIAIVKKYSPVANFIVCSDDIEYAKSKFSHLDGFHFFHKSEIIDLVMMTLCQGGIMSASSYSWWAAYFSRKRFQGGLYIAPNYWMGHWKKAWDPSPEIKVNWIKYV
jgi:hypothetical protein